MSGFGPHIYRWISKCCAVISKTMKLDLFALQKFSKLRNWYFPWIVQTPFTGKYGFIFFLFPVKKPPQENSRSHISTKKEDVLILLLPSSFITPSRKLLDNIIRFELLCVTNVNCELWYRNVLFLTVHMIFYRGNFTGKFVLCLSFNVRTNPFASERKNNISSPKFQHFSFEWRFNFLRI